MGKSLWRFICLSALLVTSVEAQDAIGKAGLPCLDSSDRCLRRLGDLAVASDLEIATLDRAIAYQKKKRWTVYINADGFTPLAIATRLARNLLGGGEYAAAGLTVAGLERRRAEVVINLRQRIVKGLIEYEAAVRRVMEWESRLASSDALLRLAETEYRLGEGSTERMLSLWMERSELRSQHRLAQEEVAERTREIRMLIIRTVGEVDEGSSVTEKNSR
jgi:hypothetical protein